jgi:hypothetical protein
MEGRLTKEKKKQEDLKEFTVGSAPQAAGAPKAKVPKTQKVELSEKSYPVLTGLIKGKDADSFRQEAMKVLTTAKDWANSADGQQKAQGEQIQKAYALSLALVDNAKVVR